MKKYFTLLLASTFVLTTQATERVVTNNEEVTETPGETEGSLSYWIENAEDGDVIVFDESLSGATIKFSAGVTLMKTLTIDASALSLPIVFDGQKTTEFFQLSDYDNRHSNDQTNTFKNIIFINGFTDKADRAAGVNVFSKRSYFINCQFIDNVSTDAGTGRQPGAIRNSNSQSFMYITDCVFKGNETARKGGAIAIDAPTTYIDRCLFDSNKAGDSGAVIDTKSGTPGGENTAPVLDIRNTTFVNNTCNYPAKKNDGIVIFNGQDKDDYPLPIRLINCTFVGNENLAHSDVSTVYSMKFNIEVTGCVFGGNKFLKDETMQYANDVRVGATPGKIISYGYNITYSMKDVSEQESNVPYHQTDEYYKEWTMAPLFERTVNEEGVLAPNLEEEDLWKKMKVIPIGHLADVLGDNPKDQTGAVRSSKLGYIGAYEYPSFVVEVTDDEFGANITEGTHLFKAGEEVELINASDDFSWWLINGDKQEDNPYTFIVEQDSEIEVRYGEIIDGIANQNSETAISLNGDLLSVKGFQGGDVKVYSVNGVVELTNKLLQNEATIELNTLSQGVHIIVATDANGNVETRKIVK